MDVENEQIELRQYMEDHGRRVEHLAAQIDRMTREVRLHEAIRSVAQSRGLSEVMRHVEETVDPRTTTPSELRRILLERGIAVPMGFDVSAERLDGRFLIRGTYSDDMFAANLYWSSEEGFRGQVVNFLWRREQSTSSGGGE
jgi:hypothetical protein